jgi:hypothetical protein
LQQAIHVLGFIERNIRVVARVQDMDVQMLRRRFDDVSQTEYSGPVVYDACGEEIYDPRVAAQGFEDGEDATDFVGLEGVGRSVKGATRMMPAKESRVVGLGEGATRSVGR